MCYSRKGLPKKVELAMEPNNVIFRPEDVDGKYGSSEGNTMHRIHLSGVYSERQHESNVEPDWESGLEPREREEV